MTTLPVEWCELPEPHVALAHHPQAGSFALVDRRVPPGRAAAVLEVLARFLDLHPQETTSPDGDTAGPAAAAIRSAIAADTTRRTRAGPGQPLGAAGAHHLTVIDASSQPHPTSSPRTATVPENEPDETPDDEAAVNLRTDRAHSARIYDHLLGGKTNYAPDREAAQASLAVFPDIGVLAHSQRAFMHRTVAAVAEAGVDQFLDLGTGIPTEPNLHQVVQGVQPAARVVYVDNDPIVLAHAQALMTSTEQGAVAYLQADVRDPTEILRSRTVLDTLDLTRPVAVSVIGLLHFLPDDVIAQLLAALRAVMVPGSHLTLNAGTLDFDDDGRVERAQAEYARAGIVSFVRPKAQFAAMFDGLELLEPGIVPTVQWRPPENRFTDAVEDPSHWGAVGRVP